MADEPFVIHDDPDKNRPIQGEVPRMSDEDLRAFVVAFCDGRIFSTAHMRNLEDAYLVFMPLFFGAGDFSRSWIESIGVVYEYMDKAGPRSINGMPIFFSCRFVHRDDWERARQAIIKEEARRANIEV